MKIRLRSVTAYFSVCYFWFGLLSNNVSLRFGGAVYIGISYAIMLFATQSGRIEFKSRHVFMQKAFIALIVFALVSFFGYEFLLEKQNKNRFFVFEFSADGFNILKNFPLWCAGMLLVTREDDNQDGLRKIFWAIMVYNVAVTLLALFAIPEFAKNMTAAIKTFEMQRYLRIGAMGFEFAYSIAILIPILFYVGVKNRNIWQKGFAVLCCFYVYKCSFLIALIAVILNAAILILWKLFTGGRASKIFAVGILIAFISVLFQTDRLGAFFLKLSQTTDSFELSKRLYDLSQMFLYNDTSAETLNRFELYSNTLKGAITHPILGTAIDYSGAIRCGHSTILDSWSLYGVFGLIPFLLMVYYALKYTLSLAKDKTLKTIVIAAYITFVFVATFNPVLASPHILLTILWAMPMLAKAANKKCTALTV